MRYELFLKRNWDKLKILKFDSRYLNSIRFCPLESFGHRITKLVICHLLAKSGHFFATELPINEAKCDIIDLSDFIVYEIEANTNSTIIKKKMDDFRHPFIEDLMIVDLKKLGLDWTPFYALKDKISKRFLL